MVAAARIAAHMIVDAQMAVVAQMAVGGQMVKAVEEIKRKAKMLSTIWGALGKVRNGI